MEKGVAEFLDRDIAVKQSPMAARLFDVDGVKSVFYGADFVAVTKEDAFDWADLKTFILGVLFEQFSLHSQPLLLSDSDGSESIGEESDTVKKIRELLDTRVRPAVARDGGDIVFHSFDKGILFLQMRGACSGCPSSTMTLKMGIENMMRHFVPEVLEVRAVAD